MIAYGANLWLKWAQHRLQKGSNMAIDNPISSLREVVQKTAAAGLAKDGEFSCEKNNHVSPAGNANPTKKRNHPDAPN